MSSSTAARLSRMLLGALVLLSLGYGEARAWIPPAETMEKKLDSQRRPILNLRVELQELVAKGSSARLMEIVSAKNGRLLFRRHDVAQGTTEVRVWRRTDLKAMNKTKQAPVWIQWFAGLDAKELFSRLRLDRKTRSLARHGRRVLWVAGATAQQKSRAQVHFDRETGLLRRVTELRDGRVVDVSFEGQLKPESSQTIWPRFVTISDGNHQGKYEVTRLVEEATFAVDEFAEDSAHPEVTQ